MPSLGIGKLRRLSRSQRGAESEGRTEMAPVNDTPADPPPSYETAIGHSTQPLGQRETESSPTVAKTVSAPYCDTHQPPDYQSTTEHGRRQTVTHIYSTAPPAVHLQHGSSSLTEALSKVVLAGKVDAARALLEAGADIYEHSPSGTISAVHDALRGPQPRLALLLLDYPCERAYQGELSLSDATPGGEARVKFLLSVQDEDGCTPLHLAASVGAADVVREMLGLGASVDAKDKLGRTPLHMAARYGRDEAMDVLLEHGADACLVREALWKCATPKVQSGLGDCAFVMRSVAEAGMRRQGVKGDADIQDGVSSPREQSVKTTGHPREDEKLQRNEVLPLASASKAPPRRSSASSASTAGYGTSIEPWSTRDSGSLFGRYQAGPTPSRGGFCTRLNKGTGRTAGRLPHVSMYSPQYSAWSKMCQTVQEEHRRQKERNVEAGYGPYEG